MGIPVLIMGHSGSGKSTSMRNFDYGELFLVNVARKPLPFRGNHVTYDCDRVDGVINAVMKAPHEVMVIDDCQYLMANEYMRRAKETGFQKFTDIGLGIWNLIQVVIDKLPKDKIIYFMAHTERNDSGVEKMKTIGKMLDEKITVEGMFTIVLKAICADGRYLFRTQNDGSDTVKSPMDMFPELEIDNDLKMVDMAIRKYWGLTKPQIHIKEEKKS